MKEEIVRVEESVEKVKSQSEIAPPEEAGASATAAAVAAVSGRIGPQRWVICALLFFGTTVNYVDPLVFGLLSPELQKMFHWTASDYTDIVFWFEVAYAIGLVGAGRVLDKVGTRLGYAAALLFWSLASILHAGMSTILGFSIARFLLGLSEAG